MTVGELQEKLEGKDPSTPVLISTSDGEASPLAGVGDTFYFAYNTWRGEIIADEDKDSLSEEERVSYVPAVILDPTH